MPSLEDKIVSDWVRELFEKQRETLPTLRKSTAAGRVRELKNLRQWIVDNKPSIRKAIYADFNKPEIEVDTTEIFPVLDEISLAVKNLDRWMKPKRVDAPITMIGTWSSIMYEPRGVCLIIAPWNYPFTLCAGPLVSALAAGNSAILKPSELTPHTSALIKRMCEEVFDESRVAVCEGGADMAQRLLQLPFDHIFFTGSPNVGKHVMRAAAENLTSVTLELGGKSPAIVSPTASITKSARRIAVAKFINNGQTCIAPDYVLVHSSVASKLVGALADQIRALFQADHESIIDSPHYARVVNERHFDRLCNMLQDAIDKGANIDYGGEVDKTQRFVHPTILSNVGIDALVMQDEIFGPILPILSYDKLEDAIRLVNSLPKPLALYYFGNNNAESKQLNSQVSAGGVCINDCAIHFLHHNLPFGGVNNSGIGKSHGYYGFLAFSNEKPVLKQNNWLTSVEFLYPPYTRKVRLITNALLRLISR